MAETERAEGLGWHDIRSCTTAHYFYTAGFAACGVAVMPSRVFDKALKKKCRKCSILEKHHAK